MGQPLMPWQRLVAEIGGELNDDGIPAYRDVVLTVPRQNGKTTLVLAWEVQRAIGWEHLGPQRIAYSAQTGNDARKKLIEDQVPILERHSNALGIKPNNGILRGMGNESVVWRNGSRLVLMASTESAGHGKTIDLGIKDELFADSDDRRDQALRPSMITRSHAQTLALSTMGTEESVPWNALVDRGRAAVEAGRTSGLAYFEWSAPDDADPNDPATWWGCMPALGWTITEATVSTERQGTMKDGEFRRAYLNQRTKSDDRVIPASLWNAVCRPDAAPTGRLAFGLDRPWNDGAGGAIVAASIDPRPTLEVVEANYPTGRLVERAVELNNRWAGAAWAVDATGPANRLVAEMERQGLRVHTYVGRDLIDACGSFLDAVMDETVLVRAHPALDDAVAAAAKREVGDAWAWTRKNSNGNIAPLVAATLARAEATADTDVAANVW